MQRTLVFVILLLAGQAVAEVAPRGVRVPVTFTAPGKGFVSLALYDGNGVLLRTLLSAEPMEAGERTVQWDGTTDLGVPAAPGTYSAKGIFFTEPPSMNYVMTVGKSGNPPYRTPDGKGDWGANLGQGTSIASNGKDLIIGFACVEDNQITGVQQIGIAGNVIRRYFTFYPWDQRSAAAMDEKNYFLGIYAGTKHTTEIAVYTLGEPRGKILAQLPVKAVPQKSGRWKGTLVSSVDGMAVAGQTVYASVAHENALFLIDRTSGAIRKRVDIPSPRGLAIAGGRLLAVSGEGVLSLSLEGDPQQTLVEKGTLQLPNALAVDRAGNLYVGDSGAGHTLDVESDGGSKQVYVFSPEGQLQRKLGKPGGAPREGRFDPNGFGIISSLAIGPDGKLWVNDIATGFKRTSRWTVEGQLEVQWFTRKLQHVADVVNPGNPKQLLSARDAFDDSPAGLYAYEIDPQNKTWKPAWSYEQTVDEAYAPAKGVFVSHDHGGNPLKAGDAARTWPIFDFHSPSFVHHNGRDYIMSGAGNGEGTIHTFSADRPPHPVALVSFHRAERRREVVHGFYDNGPNNWFTWADRDGNRSMAAGEITFTENPANLASALRVHSARLTEGLKIRMRLLSMENGKAGLIDAELAPKEVTADGVPVYDWTLVTVTGPLQMPDFRGGDGTKAVANVWSAAPLETSIGLFGIVEPSPAIPLRLPGLDGDGWWASRNWRKKLVCWDPATGALCWAVGRRAPGRAERGQMYNPIMVAGTAGDAVLVADGLAVVWVWHKEGLYLGRLFNDFGSGVQDANNLYVELQGSGVYTDPATGKHYSIANDTSSHFHELNLPKTTPIVASKVTLDAATVSSVVPWDPEGVAPTEKPSLDVFPTASPVKVDGHLDGREGWFHANEKQPRPEMLVLLDGKRLANVGVMYDAENLYLGYQVAAPTAPVNSGSELPHSPFVSGAYVDFYVGPQWNGPREDVQPGDVRVILARVRNGGGFEAFQRGFWQVKPDGKHPETITSPAARIRFDDISEVAGLQMAYGPEKVDEKTGLHSYIVEVAVPLASVGLADPVGKTVGFDVSVAVANAAGDRRERAAHWAGLSEAVVVDRPGSAGLLPRNWGQLTFRRTK